MIDLKTIGLTLDLSFQDTKCDCQKCLISVYTTVSDTSTDGFVDSICDSPNVALSIKADFVVVQFRIKPDGEVNTTVFCKQQGYSSVNYPAVQVTHSTTVSTTTVTTTKTTRTTTTKSTTTTTTTTVMLTNSTQASTTATSSTTPTTQNPNLS
jgi:hypothetical protein